MAHLGSTLADFGPTPDPGSRILDPGSVIQDPESRVLDPGSWIEHPSMDLRIPGSMEGSVAEGPGPGPSAHGILS